jgi:hypothetical protein
VAEYLLSDHTQMNPKIVLVPPGAYSTRLTSMANLLSCRGKCFLITRLIWRGLLG